MSNPVHGRFVQATWCNAPAASIPNNPQFIDRRGHRFGRLIVKEYLGRNAPHTFWRCLCDCGSFYIGVGAALAKGIVKSCGCLNQEERSKRKKVHGESQRTTEYQIWTGMRRRCLQKTDKGYPDYGGRGITICERWINGDGDLSGFQCFLADMGRRPSKWLSLDRRNNNEGYSPDNCRWATKKEQALNRRPRRTSNAALAELSP